MRLFYRISDNSYQKEKLIGATKEVCFMNFCKAFHEVIFSNIDQPPITIIADKCSRQTVKMLTDTGLPVMLSDCGNAGSFRFALDVAMDQCKDDEVVYFCEDDYLHLGSSPVLLKEGVKIADYVSLYDHPDKYTEMYGGGEVSKVVRTRSSHWRYTISTCMTFGTTMKVIKKDLDVWKRFTDGFHPHDHQIFVALAEQGRTLAVPIPGVACHTDLTLSAQTDSMLIDHWAIDLMIEELESQIEGVNPSLVQAMVSGKTGWEKLVALGGLRH